MLSQTELSYAVMWVGILWVQPSEDKINIPLKLLYLPATMQMVYLTFGNGSFRGIKCFIGSQLGLEYCILFKLNLTYFYTIHVCLCMCSKWRVVTGTDYVLVSLFIIVGAHGVSVVDDDDLHTSLTGWETLPTWFESNRWYN